MDHSLIEQMLDPAVYPEPTKTVTHLQTHISHLFLTDSRVYKIKKPVDFGFLDFTTLDKRRFYCLEELRLNRRLSPEIYLDLVALRDNGAGGISLSGTGPVLEYAVKMQRMPEERMMARLLEHGGVTAAHVDAIARKVARFHAEAARGNGIELFGTVEAIRNNWLENLMQAKAYLGRTVSEQDHRLIGDWVLEHLSRNVKRFNQRITDGFIRECDGDLHTENICLDGQVHIFDCIEFNERFRYSDTAADVAFLAMDLENHGRLDLAQRFVEQYIIQSADNGLQHVLPLYLANRAFIRGKVESFRLDDPLISDHEKTAATIRAKRFFRLARGYVLREKITRTLFLTCGPTGSGKTALASELAFQLGLHHHSSDLERKRLAGMEPTQRCSDIYDQNWNQATYASLLKLARKSLHAAASVVVDATFRTRNERQRFIQMATAAGAAVVILRPSCPADLVRQRLEIRQHQGNVVSDGTWEIYQQQMTDFEEPTADEARMIVLDAALPPVAQVNQVFENLQLFPSEKEK